MNWVVATVADPHRATQTSKNGIVSTLLIDKHGNVSDAASDTIRARIGITKYSSSVERFLIRNSGYVACRLTGNSAFVVFTPASISLQACLSVSRILNDNTLHRVVLSWFKDGWHQEVLAGHTAARERLLRIIFESRSPNVARYFSRKCHPDGLANDNSLARLLAFWQLRGQKIDVVSDAQALASCTNGRYLAIARNSDNGSIFFSAMGAGWSIYDESWPERTIGQRVEHQPDLAYGRWVASCYEKALISNQPQVTDNDVFVTAPFAEKPRRVGYQRLTLPITDHKGRPGLLSATRLDPDIRLDRVIGHKGR